MRWLFIACSTVIAFVYYIGARRSIKDMDRFNQGMTSTLYALTGRNAEGQWRDYPISPAIQESEEEDDTPYYFPPGLPKEEKDVAYLK